MDRRDLINDLINEEKERHYKSLTEIIEANIHLDKEKTYFYKCNGSGYYLKFNEVRGEYIVLDIYTKGGKKKGTHFFINWYGINELKEYTKTG